MSPSITSRVHRWWTVRKARHHRLAQFQLLTELPAEIRSDISRQSLAEAFDDGAARERQSLRASRHRCEMADARKMS